MCVYVWSDEVDEIEVYGSEAQSGTLLTTYSFEVMKNGFPVVVFLLLLLLLLFFFLDSHKSKILLCCRFVTAYSTLDPVQTPQWGSLPSCRRR